MRKAVTVVGNSFALILDKALCRLLHLTAGSYVNMELDGTTLVISPTGETKKPVTNKRGPVVDDPPPVEEDPDSIEVLARDNSAIVIHLAQCGLEPDHIERLTGRKVERYMTAIRRLSGDLTQASACDIIIARRVRAVLWQRRAQANWNDAIAAAIERYPFPSSADMSAGSGASTETAPPAG